MTATTSELALSIAFTDEEKRLILDTCCNGASESQAKALMGIAAARGLNPLRQECYFVDRWDNDKGRKVWSVQAAIDSFRIAAERTGLYKGQDEPEYEYDKDGHLMLARVRVYRSDWDRPAIGVARYGEYVQLTKEKSPTHFWKKSPHNQLAKCAEALAFRKGFPVQLSKIYTPEESGVLSNGELHGEVVEPMPPTGGAAEAFRVALLNATNSTELDLAMSAIREAVTAKGVSMAEIAELQTVARERKAAITAASVAQATARGASTPPNGNVKNPTTPKQETKRETKRQAADPPFGSPEQESPPKKSAPQPSAKAPWDGPPVEGAATPEAPFTTPPDPPKPPPPPTGPDFQKEGQSLWDRIHANADNLDALLEIGAELVSWKGPESLKRPIAGTLQQKRQALESRVNP